MTSSYAWIVDADPATEPTDDLYRVGTTGPRTAPDDLIARLRAGEGIRWRTRYEAGEDPEHHDIVHEGRLVLTHRAEDAGNLPGEGFGPLDDLSQPDCGAVEIQYLNNGRWETL